MLSQNWTISLHLTIYQTVSCLEIYYYKYKFKNEVML
jgi:hypothetical protein